jgi:hypothetical protein
MLINRRSFNIKSGGMDTAIQLIKDVTKDLTAASTNTKVRDVRLSTAFFGAFDVLVMEVEFETLAAYESYWNEAFGHPLMAAFFEKWNTLTTGGGSNELWEVR